MDNDELNEYVKGYKLQSDLKLPGARERFEKEANESRRRSRAYERELASRPAPAPPSRFSRMADTAARAILWPAYPENDVKEEVEVDQEKLRRLRDANLRGQSEGISGKPTVEIPIGPRPRYGGKYRKTKSRSSRRSRSSRKTRSRSSRRSRSRSRSRK
jgi:hypothetical protein